ncbi:MAG: ABC transporter ATP-binding protein [Desulfobulbaceae bacterium]
MIVCREISKAFAYGFLELKRKTALDNLSFEIAPGETFGIVGPNGAGKSTIIKILLGFIRPDRGEASIAGFPCGSIASRRQLGYLPERPCFYPNLTLLDHLFFAAGVAKKSRKWTAKQADNLLELVNLAGEGKTPIKNYSKGMTQRAALAYALLFDPQILILDEPMSGLDPLGRALVVDIINNCLSAGTTILFCSHILSDVERLSDRIGIMNRGRLIDTVSAGDIVDGATGAGEKPALETYFLRQINNDNQ